MPEVIIQRKEGVETSHAVVEDKNVDAHLKMYTEYGYECEVITLDEYYERFKDREFELGKVR